MTYRIVTPETFDARDIERAIEAGEVVTLHYPDRDERRARFIERDPVRSVQPAPERQPEESPAGTSTLRSRLHPLPWVRSEQLYRRRGAWCEWLPPPAQATRGERVVWGVLAVLVALLAVRVIAQVLQEVVQ